MLQRPKLTILGGRVTKVQQIDNKVDEDNAKLIKFSNQMFKEGKENGITRVHSEMQPKKQQLYLNSMIRKTRIEYLFKFTGTDGSNKTFPYQLVC